MKASELIERLASYIADHGDCPVTGYVDASEVSDILLIDTNGDFTDFTKKPDSTVSEFWLSA